MKTIVLSAFDVFGDYIANSTQLLANRINGTEIGGYHVSAYILSAHIPTYDRGVLLLDKARDLNAQGIISLGMSSAVLGPAVERRAVNMVNSKYCRPEDNSQVISSAHALGEWFDMDMSGWNVDAFISQCQSHGIFASQSSDPGAFCCNHLMLQAHLARLGDQRYSKIPIIFLHLPCTRQCVLNPDSFLSSGKQFMDLESMIVAMRILLETSSLA